MAGAVGRWSECPLHSQLLVMTVFLKTSDDLSLLWSHLGQSLFQDDTIQLDSIWPMGNSSVPVSL